MRPLFAVCLLTCSLRADILPCVNGNLSTIIGTACDIGNLRLDFTGLSSYNSTNYVPYYGPLSASDFFFTVLPNGFELLTSSPQSITGPAGGYTQESYALNFSMIDETNFITGMELSGGGLLTSGPSFSRALEALNLFYGNSGQSLSTEIAIDDINGGLTGTGSGFGVTRASYPINAATVQAGIFTLYAQDGNTASFDAATPTAYSFFTGPAPPPPPPPPIPEPHYSGLLGLGFVGLAVLERLKVFDGIMPKR